MSELQPFETRLYIYQTEVREPSGGVYRHKGQRVHQTKDIHGQWRDSEALRCIDGGLCCTKYNCHCYNCKAYRFGMDDGIEEERIIPTGENPPAND